MPAEYYLRWRSKVTGPFDAGSVTLMLSEGKITKHHQVSDDRTHWTALRESDAFGENCSRTPKTLAESAGVRVTIPVAGNMGRPVEKDRLQLKRDSDDPQDARWFYVDGGETAGPVSVGDIGELVASGVVERASPVCQEGEDRWVKAGEAFPRFWPGRSAQRIPGSKGSGAPPGGWQFAGFWLRFCAMFIDELLVAALSFGISVSCYLLVGFVMGASGSDLWTIGTTAQIVVSVVTFFLRWVYYTCTEASGPQASPGKRAMGILVTDMDGNRISFGRATGRYFSKILSGLFFGIGYLMAAFTVNKQALHDMMAGTLVVKHE